MLSCYFGGGEKRVIIGQGGNLIEFFDRLKLGDPPKARTEEEARGGQTDEGERGGEVTQL